MARARVVVVWAVAGQVARARETDVVVRARAAVVKGEAAPMALEGRVAVATATATEAQAVAAVTVVKGVAGCP